MSHHDISLTFWLCITVANNLPDFCMQRRLPKHLQLVSCYHCKEETERTYQDSPPFSVKTFKSELKVAYSLTQNLS